jgi:hypothetical protein
MEKEIYVGIERIRALSNSFSILSLEDMRRNLEVINNISVNILSKFNQYSKTIKKGSYL